jgi:hypothetical protein
MPDLQAAAAAVANFFKAVIDSPDEAKAKSLLSESSLAGGSFALPDELKSATYTINPPTLEGEDIFVLVNLTDPATGMSQSLPFAPVLENGQWKLDMNKMMNKLMGPMMEAMADGLGQAMSAVGDTLSSALGAIAGDESAAPKAPDLSPAALEKYHARLQRILDETRNRFSVEIPLDIDLPSLLTADSQESNDRLLDVITEQVLLNYPYAADETNRRIPLEGRVKSLRLEGVSSAAQRALFAEGARIVYRLNLLEPDGFYDGMQLARILTGVAAGMPEESRGELRKGPSYRPEGGAEQIVNDYRELVLPLLARRLGEIVGHDVEFDVLWSDLEYNDRAENLWIWGLNRIVGAAALLALDENSRDALAELQKITVTIVSYPGGKSLEYQRGELRWYFSPADGEAGCFYEADIADALSAGMKLKTRPMVKELERYCEQWEKQLLALFGRPIRYSVDYEAFTADPDEGKNVFALTLLREHGIDRLFYALSNLAEKNPNFKQQFPQRIAWLRIENAWTNDAKSLSGDQTCILYRLFVHEGYKGYLLPKDVEKQLPAIVAAMPEIVWDEPAAPVDEIPPADQSELEELQSLSDDDAGDAENSDDAETPDTTPAPDGDHLEQYSNTGANDPFLQMQAQINAMLPAYAQQCTMLLNKPVPFEIEWPTVDHNPEVIGLLLNASLTPLLGGIALLAQDKIRCAQLHTLLDRILIRQAHAPTEHGFAFDAGVLSFSAYLSPGMPPMDPQLAASLLGAVLNNVSAGKSAKPKKAAPRSKKPGPKKKPKKRE